MAARPTWSATTSRRSWARIGLALGAVAVGLIVWFVIWVNRHEDEMVKTAEEEMGKQRNARDKRPGRRGGVGAPAENAAEGG